MALKRFNAALTVAATAHAANAVIGGLLTLYGLGAPPGIKLRTVQISDSSGLVITYRLTIFDAVPTTIADDAPMTPADADLNNIISEPVLDAPTYQKVYTNNSVHIREGMDVDLMSSEASGHLYGMLWSPTGGTFVATVLVGLLLLYEDQ